MAGELIVCVFVCVCVCVCVWRVDEEGEGRMG